MTFPNRDGQHLAARLDLPDSATPNAFALFAHCFTCSKNLRAVANISKSLTDAEIGVLRFDFTGLGESEGDFSDTNFSSNISDLVDAAAYLDSEYRAPAILIGHSFGGAAVIQAANAIPSALAVATIGAPSEPSHVTHLLTDNREVLEAEGEAQVTLGGRSFKIKKQFLDDLEETEIQESILKLRRALLIFHSPVDNTVGIDNASQIYLAARHPKSFVSLDQADHLLSNEKDSLYVGSVIAAWARRYIETVSPPEEDSESSGDWVEVRTGRDHYRTEITADRHSLLADEPTEYGGTGTGPSPYDYLLASLGSCTAITLRMYADRKKWPLDRITVRLKHDKIHATDCEECETETGNVDQIEREITLEGDLNDEQRGRLLEIADKCPVHRTLHSEIVVKTKLVG
jgi:uncharacterized OsmC-like protein/alpha/beta superfamily hydrolase